MMKLRIIILFALIMLITFSFCHFQEWQKVEYITELKCDSLNTENISHQDGYYSIKCDVYFETDTLIVFIPSGLIGWQYVTMKIHNGKFKAETGGVPFEQMELSFKTIKQKLQLGKKKYAINDTLCGYCDFLFQNIDKKTNEICEWNFKATICEVVRNKNFDPGAEENFMQFDLSAAIREIGEPLNRKTFNMVNLPESGVELLRYFQPSKDITIEEVTWDISPMRKVSDEGRERLTIWYVQNNNNRTPVHYLKWTEDEQF